VEKLLILQRVLERAALVVAGPRLHHRGAELERASKEFCIAPLARDASPLAQVLARDNYAHFRRLLPPHEPSRKDCA